MKIIKQKNKPGFTLAEVLITLGIIGVVAAITIPTLMNSIQDNQYKVAYKKAYSIASQAWISAATDSAIVMIPSWNDASARITNFTAFKSYFKVAKDCNNSNNSECWASTGEAYQGCPDSQSTPAFIDNSGMGWSVTGSATESYGQELLLDTNGLKGPNKYGQDRFLLIPDVNNVINRGNTTYPMLPQILRPYQFDFTSYDPNFCISGNTHPCYYKSWLFN